MSAPDTQALIISILMLMLIGVIVGSGFAWLRPGNWMSAVALGCGVSAIGLSVLGMCVLKR